MNKSPKTQPPNTAVKDRKQMLLHLDAALIKDLKQAAVDLKNLLLQSTAHCWKAGGIVSLPRLGSTRKRGAFLPESASPRAGINEVVRMLRDKSPIEFQCNPSTVPVEKLVFH